ncbi:MAG: hypothetical protein LKJ44_04795 [Bifidobacteriaceae bacterium]|nr:hypothetical protein [Bifidobacteriaceae bacterium]MCI1979016.1 hypothetical protein [Bifidobacteriaceae bacterium]
MRVLRWLRMGFAAVVVAASVLVSLGYFALFADRYHVLRPSSAGGCSVVVEVDGGAWFDTFGNVYLMRPDSRVLTDTGGSWSVSNNSVADPIEEGTWSLRWDHKTANLSIWATDRIYDYSPKPIVCPE